MSNERRDWQADEIQELRLELDALKKVLKVAVPKLIRVMRMPSIEHVGDAHNEALKTLEALLEEDKP